jgi:hypothetical protein
MADTASVPIGLDQIATAVDTSKEHSLRQLFA